MAKYVKLNTARVTARGGNQAAGDVVELDDAEATRYVEKGMAVFCDANGKSTDATKRDTEKAQTEAAARETKKAEGAEEKR